MIRDEAFVSRAPASLRGYDAKLVSQQTGLDTGSESLVQQHFADEVDINVIMKRFGISKELPLGPASGVYGDFTGISDYESALERIRGADERFMKLDPEIRERFANDPGRLIAAAENLPSGEFEAMFDKEVLEPVVPVVPAVPVVPVVPVVEPVVPDKSPKA